MAQKERASQLDLDRQSFAYSYQKINTDVISVQSLQTALDRLWCQEGVASKAWLSLQCHHRTRHTRP